MDNNLKGSSGASRFSSRWGLILSVLGIAVGTGNIWRFPRIAAANGGETGAGAFLFAWLIFLLAWSIPLIIAEYALGRKGRLGVVGTFTKMAGEKYAWMGAFVAFVATAIMFYYSVVAGWCMFYVAESVGSNLPISTEQAMATWGSFQASGWPIVFHAVAIGVGGLVCFKGVYTIERANKVLVPALLLIVLISVVRAVLLPGSFEGIKYLFTPEWSQLGNASLWLEALTQNAWDTGAGWGLILTYAAYMRTQDGVVKNSILTGVGNNMVSLIAAVTIFGTVFATLGADMQRAEILEVMRTSGPASTGLTFIWMPQLFAKIAFGKVLAILFFVGLTFAAFSSLISMIELATRVVVDLGMTRQRAIILVVAMGFLLGLPSARNLDLLGNQDFVWGVALMISGAFVAFAIMRYGTTRMRDEINAETTGDWSLGRPWELVIRYLIPLQAVVLLVWWMYRSATEYSPDRWFDPFDYYSVMTCVGQWLVVLIVFIVANRFLARRSLANQGTVSPGE